MRGCIFHFHQLLCKTKIYSCLFIYLINFFLSLSKELRIYLWLCSICLMLVVVVVGLSMIMDDVCLDLFIVKMARQLNIIHHLTHGSTHVWLF